MATLRKQIIENFDDEKGNGFTMVISYDTRNGDRETIVDNCEALAWSTYEMSADSVKESVRDAVIREIGFNQGTNSPKVSFKYEDITIK